MSPVAGPERAPAAPHAALVRRGLDRLSSLALALLLPAHADALQDLPFADVFSLVLPSYSLLAPLLPPGTALAALLRQRPSLQAIHTPRFAVGPAGLLRKSRRLLPLLQRAPAPSARGPPLVSAFSGPLHAQTTRLLGDLLAVVRAHTHAHADSSTRLLSLPAAVAAATRVVERSLAETVVGALEEAPLPVYGELTQVRPRPPHHMLCCST
jgi:hypothetical protein